MNSLVDWSLRIALARFRPFDGSLIARASFTVVVVALLLAGDYAVFRRLFRAAGQIEALNPFFALGLLENFFSLVFLVASSVLFFSALTTAIGAFFTDFDLEIYHAAPVPVASIVLSRWTKALVRSGYVVVIFLLPMIVAFAQQYDLPFSSAAAAAADLLLLTVLAVSAACAVILILVRYFPVRRVHQVAATLAVLTVVIAVVGVRLARPERLFTAIQTDELTAVLNAIDLPAGSQTPPVWFAESLAARAETPSALPDLRLLVAAAVVFALFFVLATRLYFTAFVRARETSAPPLVAAGRLVRLVDALTRRSSQQMRALVGKEARVISREAAQWSQLLMMAALLFLYLYNIRIMPLEGDFRAALLAYLNIAMTGFIVSAMALRFAYPSLSIEGKQFWLIETAPLPAQRLIGAKLAVYALPLWLLALMLTAATNMILQAPLTIWLYTLGAVTLIVPALVSLAIAMGVIWPSFESENPIDVALSLGGIAYMAVSLLYVGAILFLMARPLVRFVLRIIFGAFDPEASLLHRAGPWLALGLGIVTTLVPLYAATMRLAQRHRL